MPRRYQIYRAEFQVWNVMSSAGAVALAAAYLLPMGYLAWSLVWGRRAGSDPWDATGLEWQTTSPSPRENATRRERRRRRSAGRAPLPAALPRGPHMTGLGEDVPKDTRAVLRHGLVTWAALVALVALTCALAYVPTDRFNGAVSLAVAAAKALVIALFFMNLRRPDPILRLAGAASLLCNAFLFTLTFADVLMRTPLGRSGTAEPREGMSRPGQNP